MPIFEMPKDSFDLSVEKCSNIIIRVIVSQCLRISRDVLKFYHYYYYYYIRKYCANIQRQGKLLLVREWMRPSRIADAAWIVYVIRRHTVHTGEPSNTGKWKT